MNLLEMLESAKTKLNYADTPLLIDAAIFEMCAIERRVQEAVEEGALNNYAQGLAARR